MWRWRDHGGRRFKSGRQPYIFIYLLIYFQNLDLVPPRVAPQWSQSNWGWLRGGLPKRIFLFFQYVCILRNGKDLLDALPLHYTPFWDTASLSDAAHLNMQVNFICTAVLDQTLDHVKVRGFGQGGFNNQTNCWCLVSIKGVLWLGKVLWIFH